MSRIFTSLFLVLVTILSLQAQLVYHGNPADRSYHEGLRVNPALAAWQPVAFEVEWRLMHLGLAESPAAFGQGGFSFSIPRYSLALVAVHRDTDLLAESEIWLSWAYRFKGKFSVGLQGGLRRIGWNLSHSPQSVRDDPVFSSGSDRLQPDIGIGGFWEISPSLRAGISLRHINHPSLSLKESEPYVPIRLNAGMEWSSNSVRIGLSVDNDSFDESNASIGDELTGDLEAMLALHWRAVESVELDATARKNFISAGIAVNWNTVHQLRYKLEHPLGDFADQAGSSHQMRYRFDIAGGIFMPHSYNPDLIPWDNRENLRRLFGIPWDPEKITFLFELEKPRIELLELHVQLDDSLQTMISTSMLEMRDILAISPGEKRSIAPRSDGELRDTYSRKYFQLAGLLEEMAVENGIVPVIHAGKSDLRIEDIATLAGVPVESREYQEVDGRLLEEISPVPDSLQVNIQLPAELDKAVDHWKIVLEAGGILHNQSSGEGSLPAKLALAVRNESGKLPPTGNSILRLQAYDDEARLIVSRERIVKIVRKVRNVSLRIYQPGLDMPQRIDEIHIHMGDD
jgi:hypothetical protein